MKDYTIELVDVIDNGSTLIVEAKFEGEGDSYELDQEESERYREWDRQYFQSKEDESSYEYNRCHQEVVTLHHEMIFAPRFDYLKSEEIKNQLHLMDTYSRKWRKYKILRSTLSAYFYLLEDRKKSKG